MIRVYTKLAESEGSESSEGIIDNRSPINKMMMIL
jgi:hypothetical protein